MPNAIIIQNVTKKYKLYSQPIDRLKEALHPFKKSHHRDFLANNDISFSIKKGEVVGIIGKNGSGKSTLLKMITGVLTPSSGTIEVHGKITAMLELGAGFNPELTGMENLYMSGAISGFGKEEMEAKIADIVAFADIGEFIHQPLKTYSSGMKARVGFAFAIHSEPEILIIDEALSVGDVAFQRKCYARIEDMCKDEGITVLFVSHSGGVVKQLCSRAIMLLGGQKVLDGTPKDVVNFYEKFGESKHDSIATIQKEFKTLQENATKPLIAKPQTLSSYNLNLVSKSMVVYEEKGARIFDIKLLDKNGKMVNIIEKYQNYIYTYNIMFQNDYQSVQVAMRIKNTQGIELTGHMQKLDNVTKEKIYRISFEFENILNGGEYFFNSGANSTVYGEFIMLHRVIDGYMIKVIDDIQTHSRGVIDFKFKGSYN